MPNGDWLDEPPPEPDAPAPGTGTSWLDESPPEPSPEEATTAIEKRFERAKGKPLNASERSFVGSLARKEKPVIGKQDYPFIKELLDKVAPEASQKIGDALAQEKQPEQGFWNNLYNVVASGDYTGGTFDVLPDELKKTIGKPLRMASDIKAGKAGEFASELPGIGTGKKVVEDFLSKHPWQGTKEALGGVAFGGDAMAPGAETARAGAGKVLAPVLTPLRSGFLAGALGPTDEANSWKSNTVGRVKEAGKGFVEGLKGHDYGGEQVTKAFDSVLGGSHPELASMLGDLSVFFGDPLNVVGAEELGLGAVGKKLAPLGGKAMEWMKSKGLVSARTASEIGAADAAAATKRLNVGMQEAGKLDEAYKASRLAELEKVDFDTGGEQFLKGVLETSKRSKEFTRYAEDLSKRHRLADPRTKARMLQSLEADFLADVPHENIDARIESAVAGAQEKKIASEMEGDPYLVAESLSKSGGASFAPEPKGGNLPDVLSARRVPEGVDPRTMRPVPSGREQFTRRPFTKGPVGAMEAEGLKPSFERPVTKEQARGYEKQRGKYQPATPIPSEEAAFSAKVQSIASKVKEGTFRGGPRVAERDILPTPSKRVAEPDFLRPPKPVEAPIETPDATAAKVVDTMLTDNPRDILNPEVATKVWESVRNEKATPEIRQRFEDAAASAKDVHAGKQAEEIVNKNRSLAGRLGARIWDDFIIGKVFKNLPLSIQRAMVLDPESAPVRLLVRLKQAKFLRSEATEEAVKIARVMDGQELMGPGIRTKFSDLEREQAWSYAQNELKEDKITGGNKAAIVKAGTIARESLDRLGEWFVKMTPEERRAVLTDAKFFAEKGRYMTIFYRKFLEDGGAVYSKLMDQFRKTPMNVIREKIQGFRTMGRTLPEQFREELGQIKNPVVAAKGYADIAVDAINDRLYESIALDKSLASEAPKEGWRTLPDNPKLGALRKMHVEPETYYNVMATMPESRKVIGQMYDGLMGAWKAGLTRYSPSAWAHNLYGALNSNTQATGRFWMGPRQLKNYVSSMRETVAGESSTFKALEKEGTFGTNIKDVMSRQNIREIDRILLGAKETDTLFDLMKKINEKVSNGYRLIDDANKLDIAKWGMDQGMTARQASAYAKKWGIDWDRAGYGIRWLNRYPMPFISYSALAVPRYIEASLKQPLMTNAHAFVAAGASAWAKSTWGWNNHDEDSANQSAAAWLASRSLMSVPGSTPGTYIDFSYSMPWQALPTGFGETQYFHDVAGGHPLWALAELGFNKSWHNNTPIYGENDSTEAKAKDIRDFLMRRWAPAMLGGAQYQRLVATKNGTPDYNGRVQTWADALSQTFAGVPVVHRDFAKDLERMKNDDKNTIREQKTLIHKYERMVTDGRMTKDEMDSRTKPLKDAIKLLENREYPDLPGQRKTRVALLTPEQMIQAQSGRFLRRAQ